MEWRPRERWQPQFIKKENLLNNQHVQMEGPKQEKQLDAAGGEVKEPELNMEDPAKAN